MTHSTQNCYLLRLSGALLACTSLLTAPFAQAQSWSKVAGDFQGGYIRGLFVPSLTSTTAVGDSWAAVLYGGMFKQAPGSSAWTPMNTGLTDKRAYGFAVHSGVTPYRGYVATRGGGIFKTTDGGANWTPVNTGLGCAYVYSVAFIGLAATTTPTVAPATNGIGATASTDRLLAGTGVLKSPICASSGGVYLSTDGGATWTLTSGMSPGVNVISVTRVNPVGGIDYLIAGTYDGVYKSTDNGLNWTLSNGAMTNPNEPTPNVNNVTYLYSSALGLALFAAESNTGVWKSTDNGVTWGTAPVLNAIVTGAGIGTDGNSNGNLYYPVDGQGVYMSADRGANWTTLFASAAALPGARAIQRDTTVAGSPIFYAQTYAGVYQSADGGATWNKASTGLPGGYVINGGYDSSGNAYVAAAEGVFQAPPSGGTFQRLGGYNLGYFGGGGHIIVAPGDVPYAVTFNLGVFKYDGTNWVAKNAGLPNLARNGSQLRSDPNNANGLYLGLVRDGMYYSADGGNTWTARNSGLTGNALRVRHMATATTYTLVATDDGLYKSTDTGASWTRISFAAKSPSNVELPIDHMRIDSGNGNIYAAVNQTDSAGAPFPGNGVWKSTDGGANWTQSLAGMRVHEISVARVASGATLYAGLWDTVSGGAMQSIDGAATWTPINAGLTSNYIGNFGIRSGVLSGVTTYGDGVFHFTPPPAIESLNIVPGWNLLGNGMGTALSVASVFGDASKVTTVWKWLPASSNWAFYTPTLTDGGAAYAAGKGYALLTSIAAGEGFWVNAIATFTAPLAGSPLNTTSYQTMVSGWNLVATGDRPTASGFNRAISTIPPEPDVVPVNLTTLWAWDAVLKNWYFYAPSLDASGGLATYITSKFYLPFGTKALDPVTGFWVNKP